MSDGSWLGERGIGGPRRCSGPRPVARHAGCCSGERGIGGPQPHVGEGWAMCGRHREIRGRAWTLRGPSSELLARALS